jgi:hypothetical protein
MQKKAIKQVPVLVQHCTPTCALPLSQIILGNNHLHEPLPEDLVHTPNGEELDAAPRRQNSDFWVDVHAASPINPPFRTESIPVDASIFKDKNGHLFDLSKVHSPWVDPSKLKLWCRTTSIAGTSELPVEP